MESLYLSNLLIIILFVTTWVHLNGFEFCPPEKFGQEFIVTGCKKAKGTLNLLSESMS